MIEKIVDLDGTVMRIKKKKEKKAYEYFSTLICKNETFDLHRNVTYCRQSCDSYFSTKTC